MIFLFLNSFFLLLCTFPCSQTVTQHIYDNIIKPINTNMLYVQYIQNISGSFWPPQPIFIYFSLNVFLYFAISHSAILTPESYMQKDRIWMLLMKLIKRQTSLAFFFCWGDRQIGFIILALALSSLLLPFYRTLLFLLSEYNFFPSPGNRRK